MGKINKLHLGVGFFVALLAFIGLYFFYSYIPQEVPGIPQIGMIEVPEESSESEIVIFGAYWGTRSEIMPEDEVCSNETKNKPDTTFTIEANTGIRAPAYDDCFVENNRERIETKVMEMHGNYVRVQAEAETDRPNEVRVCCLLEERMDCSRTTNLILCK